MGTVVTHVQGVKVVTLTLFRLYNLPDQLPPQLHTLADTEALCVRGSCNKAAEVKTPFYKKQAIAS